jgi:opacity protein-like surface antigen
MRIVSLATAVAAAGLSLAASAHAQSRWYISGDLGGYFREDGDGSETFSKLVASPATSTTTVTKNPDGSITAVTSEKPPQPPHLVKAQGTAKSAYDPGLVGHVALGYRLTSHLRVEAELGGTGYDRSKISPYTADLNFPELNGSALSRRSGGSFQRFTGEMNAFYDFAPLGRLATPYAGFGLGGWAAGSSTGVYAGPTGSFTQSGGHSTSAFAMVEAGVSLRLSRHWSVVPAYRYVHVLDGTTGNRSDVAHLAKVGMRYAF